MNGPDEEVVDESSLTERYLVDAIAPLTRHKKNENYAEEDPTQQDNLATTDKTSSDDGESENQAPSSRTYRNLRARPVKRFWKIDLYLGWRNSARASRFAERKIFH